MKCVGVETRNENNPSHSMLLTNKQSKLQSSNREKQSHHKLTEFRGNLFKWTRLHTFVGSFWGFLRVFWSFQVF